MQSFLNIGLSNAVMATILAIIAFFAGWCFRRPAVRHTLWLLVLLKLVTPPVFPLATPLLTSSEDAQAASATEPMAAPQESPFTFEVDEETYLALRKMEEDRLESELADLKERKVAVQRAAAQGAADWTAFFMDPAKAWIWIASLW